MHCAFGIPNEHYTTPTTKPTTTATTYYLLLLQLQQYYTICLYVCLSVCLSVYFFRRFRAAIVPLIPARSSRMVAKSSMQLPY